MITLEIDNKTIQAEEGQTILQVALDNGIDIPHFCWHPGLSISGNCRMCLVEIEDVPKLQISCSTPVRDGMKVFTESERVIQARKGVLEFLLINHPVDCPICDQAGECSLQNYYQRYGLYKSRFKEKKVNKAKVIDLGSGVVLDRERCVLCSRCVRFLRDVAHDEQLGIFNRGNHSEIRTLDGERLDSIYAGNIHEICPVGALTSKDFRFQCRVWFLSSTPSVCPACATGCNVLIDHNNNKIHRIRARHNPDVNNYWMCDDGRYFFHNLYDEQRILKPLINDEDRLKEISYETALNQATTKLKSILDENGAKNIGIMGSSQLTNEDAYALASFGREILETNNIDGIYEPETTQVSDDILIHNDKNPNSRGIQDMGLQPERGGMNIKDMLAAARRGTLQALLIVDLDLFIKESQEKGIISALEDIPLIIALQKHRNRVTEYTDFVFPVTYWAEMDGTYTNHQGRVQRIKKAVEPPPDVFPVSKIIFDMARMIDPEVEMKSWQEIFEQISTTVQSYNGMSLTSLEPNGQLTGTGVETSEEN